MSDTLYVVTAISNANNYSSRYRLYESFKNYLKQFPSVVLYTAELALNDDDFNVTSSADPRNIQVRGNQVFWHKENLLNLAIAKLPPEAKYVAWMDADVDFIDPNWANKTIEALKKHHVVQMFSRCHDLGPNGEILLDLPSTTSLFPRIWGVPSNLPFFRKMTRGNQDYINCLPPWGLAPAPGLAWAIRKDTLDKIGGLIDWCLISAHDWHMACCFAGVFRRAGNICFYKYLSAGYRNKLRAYAALCDEFVHSDLSYVDCIIRHYWHGSKANRGYGYHWQILRRHKFDPYTDIVMGPNGLYIIDETKGGMLRDLQRNLEGRQEDSIRVLPVPILKLRGR